MAESDRSTAEARAAPPQAAPLRVGQVVVVPLGGVDQDAIVVEYYGPLGDGEQLVRLLVLDGPVEYRVPASLARLDEGRAAAVSRRLAGAAARALERAPPSTTSGNRRRAGLQVCPARRRSAIAARAHRSRPNVRLLPENWGDITVTRRRSIRRTPNSAAIPQG